MRYMSLLEALKLNWVGSYPTVPHPLNKYLLGIYGVLGIVLNVAKETVKFLIFRSLECVKMKGNKHNERGEHKVFQEGRRIGIE